MHTTSNNIDDVCQSTSQQLAAAFASGELSPVEVAQAALARAEAINGALNAFTIIDHDAALAAARASEARWRNGMALSPIDGIPTTIKDIVHFNGYDVRYGSRVTPDISDVPDAPAVQKLREAGVVFLGVTTTPEFGWKAVTDNRRDGTARNPWDHSKTPGGSSGGAAIAAATGAGVLHLGTDGGGSIRVPAAFTGIVGHKATFGQVPAYPASSFGTVAHIGPMARTVEDTAAMLTAMSGRDLRDWTQPPVSMGAIAPRPINWSGKTIGYWAAPPVGQTDSAVRSAIEATLRDLELAGACVVEFALPDADVLLEIFYRHWYVGSANRLAGIDECAHGDLDQGFLRAAQIGQSYSAVDRMSAEVARAQYGAKMDQAFEVLDFIISPTVPISPFNAGCDVPEGQGYGSWVEWSGFSFPINLSQQPACSVPCGFDADGLPIGLQIIGARGEDGKVLSAALTYQQMYPDRFLTRGGQWPLTGQGNS